MKVVDGELHVSSANAMRGYDHVSAGPAQSAHPAGDRWTATGDLVEVRGERVYFVGRRSDLINVGGNKVSPLEVEQVIRSVDGVADTRVYAQQSSIAGQLVACEIVADAGRDPQQVKQAVLAACQAGLRSFQRPRFVDFVDQIQLSGAAKRIRHLTPPPEN